MRSYLLVRQVMLLVIILGVGALLVGCASAPATPAPLASVATEIAAESGDGPSTAATTDADSVESTPAQVSTMPPTSTPTPLATSTPIPTPSLTPTPSPTPEPSVQLEAGQRHQFNGDYEQAITSYLGVLSDDPTDEQARQARYHLAETYSLKQDHIAAAAAWEDFFANHPDDARWPQATLMAARAYHAANECARAIALYEDMKSLNLGMPDALSDYGSVLNFSGRPEEAIELFKKAMLLDPMFPVFNSFNLGHAYYLVGDYQDATTHLREALVHNTEFFPAQFFLIATYVALDRIDDAREEANHVQRHGAEVSLDTWSRRLPYKDPDTLNNIVNALKQVGFS